MDLFKQFCFNSLINLFFFIPSSDPIKEKMQVFVSCQQTKAMYGVLAGLNSVKSVVSSCPPFNVREKHKEWNSVLQKQINVPVYGILIPRLIKSIFDMPDIHDTLEEVGDTRVSMEYVLDTFVQGKMSKVRALIEKFPDCTVTLKSFVDMFESRKPTDELKDGEWNALLEKCGIASGWESKLHVDHVLQLFGISDEQSKLILSTTADKYGTTFKDYAVTWISKALCGYKPKGCLTDVANLIVAMMTGSDQKKAPPTTHDDVIALLTKFKALLEDDDVGPKTLWIPDVMLMDLETDDIACVALVIGVLRRLEKKYSGFPQGLDVHVQLPVKIQLSICAFVDYMGWQVVRDPDTRNAEAVCALFGVKPRKEKTKAIQT